jgi:hypothetical protein
MWLVAARNLAPQFESAMQSIEVCEAIAKSDYMSLIWVPRIIGTLLLFDSFRQKRRPSRIIKILLVGAQPKNLLEVSIYHYYSLHYHSTFGSLPNICRNNTCQER